MKVYICSRGCRYEGGGTFYVTVDYVDAWKKIREERLKKFRKWDTEIECRKYNRKQGYAYQNFVRCGEKQNYWIDPDGYEFLSIDIYEVSNELALKQIKRISNG